MSLCILQKDVRYIKGIGEQRAALLAKVGVRTLCDLISYFPRDYEDRRNLITIRDIRPGETVTFAATVTSEVQTRHIRTGLSSSRLRAADDTGTVGITFFNQTYVKDSLQRGRRYLFHGRAGTDDFAREIQNPEFEPLPEDETPEGRIVPVYPLSAGLSQKIVLRAINAALAECSGSIPEILPAPLRRTYNLAHAEYAYRHIHTPPSFEELDSARRRLVFEELFILSAGLSLLAARRSRKQGPTMNPADLSPFFASLPFKPTGAQRRCIAEAAEDMASGKLMNRLVQGDVGSGKTAVAAACVYFAAQSGFQSVLMAPTEILASQHYKGLSPLLERFGIQTLLLTGSLTAARKREAYARIRAGEAGLIVGTHAVIQNKAEYQNLGLVVCDEQHRFGVQQRAELSGKGCDPHVLVMSATPIPRTLALILYGDLELSLLDEMPPGRQKVDTLLIGEDKRERMNRFIRENVGKGRQAYIVCPLVDESDRLELKSVTEFAEKLRSEVFTGLRVGFLHGRMKAADKEREMAAFARGETGILVSTTVIEVGVDVPAATIIVIENAERFGLSQLHQLRGRVGRGSEKSYCILISSDGKETERLRVMTETNDGFEVARRDLLLRGPGDFFGRRQHGLPKMHIADLSRTGDLDLLQQAQKAARALTAEDPDMSRPENRPIYERVRELFENENIFN